MSEIKIDKGIPVPLTLKSKYPFKAMAIGDSFFIEDRSQRSNMYLYAKRIGIKVTVREEGSGARVWRVE